MKLDIFHYIRWPMPYTISKIRRFAYRRDGSAVYRKGNEYLIVRPDQFGVEKIVTYGLNDD